jgi:hypothetical protein
MVGGVPLSKSVAAAESVKPESRIPTVNAQSCAAYGLQRGISSQSCKSAAPREPLGNLSNIMFQ